MSKFLIAFSVVSELSSNIDDVSMIKNLKQKYSFLNEDEIKTIL